MRKAIVVLPFVLGGCFSLFSFGGGGGGGDSRPLEPKLDGRIFGTGSKVLDTWDLEIKAATVFVTDSGDRLHLQNTEGSNLDMNGTWSLDVYRKQDADTLRSVLDRVLISVTGHGSRGDAGISKVFLDLGMEGLDSPVTTDEGLSSWLYVGISGNCVYEFMTVNRDVNSGLDLWNSARAGIVAIGGGAPTPDACQ